MPTETTVGAPRALVDALLGLPDNLLYRRECRAQRLGLMWLLFAAGASFIGLSWLVPCLVAPALAAIAVVRDRRGGVWDEVLLTRLTPAEVLLPKLAGSLRLPVLLLLIGALFTVVPSLVWAGVHGALGRVDIPQVIWEMLRRAPGHVLSGGPLVLMASLAGLRAGLRARDLPGGLVLAYFTFLALAALCSFAASLLAGVVNLVLDVSLIPSTIEALATSAGRAGFQVAAILLAAALWGSCIRRVRER